MTLRLFQKNIFNTSLIEYISIIFVCGFLLPKFSVMGFYTSFSDICGCILTILLFYKFTLIDIKIINLFIFELTSSFFIIFLLFFNFVTNNIDSYSYLYTSRIIIYIFASIYIIKNTNLDSYKILNFSINIITIYIYIYIFLILLNIWNFSIDEILYGYTFVRLKLPFEYSGTTSVPFGYLLSLIFTYLVATKKSHLSVYFIAQILTMSRAAVLSSSVIILLKKRKFGLIIFLLTLLFIINKTLLSGGLDHSSSDRLVFFFYSLEFYFNSFSKFIFGYGLSPSLLYLNTGYYYYENIFSQALMNGGIIFLILTFTMYLIFAFRIIFMKKYIYIPVLIGNFLGGFNLFSTISLPLYFLLVFYYNEK
jgi:hypothetical protein